MAEKSQVSLYTKTLIEVSQKLQSIDRQRLVFLCRDIIEHHDLEKINTGMELFQALEQEKHIQRDVDISVLLEILYAARRVDLSDDVAAKMNVPKFTPDSKRAISRYRYLLLEIAMTLSDREVEEVTLLAAELLGCSQDNIHDIYHLLVLLEKEGHVSAGDVHCLHQDLITHQPLKKKIKEYEEAMKKVLKEEEKGRKSYVEGCMQGTYHALHSEGDSMAEGRGTTNDNDIITPENLTQHAQELQPCSDQAEDIAVPSGKQQHQAIIPAQAALPASITAENLNMGETQNVVSGDQTYIQHVDRHIETNIERNIETNIETQVVYNIGDEKKDNSSFNLESIRKQLKDEYIQTRGKLPLLPGMPEEFARMEDLFVDLHIVEEEKKPTGILLKELKSHGDLVCITQEVEEGGKKENRVVKRILVRGKPGVGKSSTVSKLAYDWACSNQDSPISKFQLLFAITIHEIDAKTDLIGVIQDQLLPKVSRQSLEDYLQSNASSVVILLDGYDEASKYFHQSRDIKNVLCSKWLAEACVIVTTRPNQVGKFTQNYGAYLQVEILGFSDYVRKKLYIQRFMKCANINESALLNHLHKSPQLKQLTSIPIILSMLCLLWVDDQKLPTTVTALYKAVITHLAKHSYSKTATDDLDMTCVQNLMDNAFNQMGEVAIEGLFEDRLVFSSHKFKPKNLEEGCTLGIVTKEKKRSGLTVTYNVTFLHKTFQEFCAAHYWVGLIENEEEKFISYLQRVNNDNMLEMEYLLRFACGLNMKAAEIILPHMVHILCQHEDMRDYDGDVENIYGNPCQQLGISLLHEAESNNAEVGQCIELHKHLKPLIKTVKINSLHSPKSGEFHEILTSYISSAQSVTNESNSGGRVWLGDVEEVYAGHTVEDDRMSSLVESVCAMSKISILHLEGKCDLDRLSQLCMSSLTKLALDDVSVHGELSSSIHLPKVKELRIKKGSGAVCKAILRGYSPTTCIPLETMKIQEIHLEPDDLNKFMLHLRILYLQDCYVASSDCARLFDAFIDASNNIHTCSHENKGRSGVRHESKSSSAIRRDRGLVLEELDLSQNEIGDSVEGFVKAYSHMPTLKCLMLSGANMKARHCEKLFDGFIEAGQTRNDSLPLEDLDLSENEIGDSVGNLVQAYRHMTQLRGLWLSNTKLTPSHCAMLFDGFITAGKMLTQDEASSNTQGDASSTPQIGLSIEALDLEYNEIGESVDKLLEALTYMPHLNELDLDDCKLSEESEIRIDCALKTINSSFTKLGTCWWHIKD